VNLAKYPSKTTIKIKVIRNVRKKRHRNPLFGRIGDEIFKNRGKKSAQGFNGGMKLSLAANLVLN
jgi:hypothetical protein